MGFSAAAVAAAATIGSAVISSQAAGGAAKAQEGAANQASATQLAIFNTLQGKLDPFTNVGTSALGALNSPSGFAIPGASGQGIGPQGSPLAQLTSPIAPTQDQLNQFPGFQFTRDQGIQAIANANSSLGIGRTGENLADITKFATNTATQNFQTFFGDQLTQNQQIFSMLENLGSLGENAAAMTGSLGTQTGTSVGGNIVGAGNAAAAGIVGSANAFSAPLSQAGSTGLNLALLSQVPGLFPQSPAAAPSTSAFAGVE